MGRIDDPQSESKSEARILQLLREQGESSIAELARISGLGKATASRAIQSLRLRGLIEDTGDIFRRLPSGRAGQAIRIRPDVGLYLGIALARSDITIVITDAAKRVIDWERNPLSAAQGRQPPSINTVIGLADRLLSRSGSNRARLYGVGVAVAGPVNPRTGEISRSLLLPKEDGRTLQEELSDYFGKPVILDNDANCSALAELLWGNLNNHTTAVLLRLDRGVGGAIVHNGVVMRGHTGKAGDYGHIVYDPKGPYCQCGGRGCFERYLSISAAESDLGETIAAAGIRASCGDSIAIEGVRRQAVILGSLAAVVSRTVDPERILIGGGMLALGTRFLEGANEKLHSLNPAAPPIEAARAATALNGGLPNDEPALGAIGLLIRQEKSG
ncbi:ROK family transcriptional regulator [Peteryoungia desertarenae]|uniref:ROK family transcriptional regulator n=1 Tax=Peteryoungia desertarenae TaxID=1813451 RepID=A0ABX6QJ30_9HYPH|nr:ROK family transcriptional regulator [Peteryoungia desertarenae]QLF68525.1 ROK family transcriptional regulator [Peteryoungia desertarenae]